MTVNGCVGHVQRHFPEADETKWKLFFHNLEGRDSLVRTTDGFMPFVVPENVRLPAHFCTDCLSLSGSICRGELRGVALVSQSQQLLCLFMVSPKRHKNINGLCTF